jgi:hypothetical protein
METTIYFINKLLGNSSPIQELVKLFGYLAWPMSILIIVCLIRKQIKSLLDNISIKIRDPSSDVTLGKDGLEIKSRTNAALGIIESLRSEVDALKQKVFSVSKIAEITSFDVSDLDKSKITDVQSHLLEANGVDDNLKILADEYLSISSPDWNKRVREKTQLATKLGNHVISYKISRDILAKEENEGLILALASAINSFPENGDLDRLYWVKDKVTRLHVKYWIVMAIGRIFECIKMKTEDFNRAQQILDLFTLGADKSLQNRIIQTRSIIDFSKSD